MANTNQPGPDVPPPTTTEAHQPESAVIRQRLAEHLVSCWPRMAYDDFHHDVAAAAMTIVTPIIDGLHTTASAWRRQAGEATAALEQITTETERLFHTRPQDGLR